LGGSWPAINYIIQVFPRAVSPELAQRVVGNSHSVIVGQTKAPA
jgi:hypothetical protein